MLGIRDNLLGIEVKMLGMRGANQLGVDLVSQAKNGIIPTHSYRDLP